MKVSIIFLLLLTCFSVVHATEEIHESCYKITFNDLSVWDVRWDNAIVAKVNNFINVNFAFLMVYQQDQSTKVQIKEALQLGIVYTIF